MPTDRSIPPRCALPRNRDRRRSLGRLGEGLAGAYLRQLGFSILARNARTRYGEIDLIAFDGRTLVFAEVKTRRTRTSAPTRHPPDEPLSWFRARQQVRMRRLAVAWLADPQRRRPSARTIRFDAIAVRVDAGDRLLELTHVEAVG